MKMSGSLSDDGEVILPQNDLEATNSNVALLPIPPLNDLDLELEATNSNVAPLPVGGPRDLGGLPRKHTVHTRGGKRRCVSSN